MLMVNNGSSAVFLHSPSTQESRRLCRAAVRGLLKVGLFAPGSEGYSWSVVWVLQGWGSVPGSAPDSALLPQALQGELPELFILLLENVELIIRSLPHTSLTGVWVNEHLLTCGNKCCGSSGAVAALTQRLGNLQLFPTGLCRKTKSWISILARHLWSTAPLSPNPLCALVNALSPGLQ